MAINYFYYRETKDDALVGPMSYPQAIAGARYLSLDEERSGLAEICTYVGNRPQDPVIDPPILKVIHMFIRGKLTLSGHTAQYHADNNLPPIGPWAP